MALLFCFVLLAAVSGVEPTSAAAAAGGDAYDASMCQRSFMCGAHHLHYPFYLSNESKVIDGVAYSYCGYPGMAIHCDATTATATATLRLAGNTNYTVLAIDYANHTVTLADADALASSCPRPRHNVTIPREAWLNFTAAGNGTISFFLDCAFTAASPPPPDLIPINCTGFARGLGRPSFLAPQLGTPDGDWFRACREVYVAPVLADAENRARLGSGGYGEVLRRGFRLSWDPSAGPCFECEQSRGQCGYDQAGGFLGCRCPDGRVRGPDCGSKKPSKKAIIYGTSTAAAALVMFLLLLVVSFLYIRKRRQYKMTSPSRLLKYTMSGGTPRSRGSTDMESCGSVHNLQTHHFSYEELEEATGGFSGTRELGDGGFGTVYRGQLRDGRVVAVKRLYNHGGRHVEQFVNEAAILSRLRHPNLVTFYGCTSSCSRELLLVYEYVPNGTVADHLHGRRSAERALPWQLRLSIAVKAAAALAYLHAIEPPVVHRDVKTSNILLDAEFHVKVADFGLSRLLPLDGATHVSTAPQGTPGYVDPEYHRCYQLTDRSDVYSFGVVLAELISSKPAVDVTRDRGEINLADMAVGRIQRSQLDQLVDVGLGYGSDEGTRLAMTMVAELAFRCLQQNGEMRPPIREVLDVLKGIQQGGAKEGGEDEKKKDGIPAVPCSPDTVHARWESLSTTPSISQ